MPGDKTDHGFLHAGLNEFRRGLLCGAANFTDHDYGFGLRIAIKKIQGVHKIRSNDWIAANSDRRRLSDPTRCELINSFVSQRAGP